MPGGRLATFARMDGQLSVPRDVHRSVNNRQIPMPRRKRRFQVRYSLRTLLLLFLVSGCWLAFRTHRMRIERRARETIESAGGSVAFDYQIDQDGQYKKDSKSSVPVWAINTFGEELFHRIAAVHLKGWVTPDYLDDGRLTLAKVYRRPVADDTLENIATLSHLRCLDLQMTDIENKDLARLSNLRRLRRLRIGGNRIDSIGLSHLQQLPELQYVDVKWTYMHAEYDSTNLPISASTLAGLENKVLIPTDFWETMEGELSWRDSDVVTDTNK